MKRFLVLLLFAAPMGGVAEADFVVDDFSTLQQAPPFDSTVGIISDLGAASRRLQMVPSGNITIGGGTDRIDAFFGNQFSLTYSGFSPVDLGGKNVLSFADFNRNKGLGTTTVTASVSSNGSTFTKVATLNKGFDGPLNFSFAGNDLSGVDSIMVDFTSTGGSSGFLASAVDGAGLAFTAVPEPMSLALGTMAVGGLGGAGFLRRRRKQATVS